MTQVSIEPSPGSLLPSLDQVLREEFERFRASGHDPGDAFRGLYIEEEEVAGALQRLPRERREPVHAGRLETIATLLELDDFDVQVLLACLAPELDLSYESIYAFIQDDVAKKRPTVSLLLRLFAAASTRPGLRARFHPMATLFRTGLLTMPGDDAPLLKLAPSMDERVVQFLLGHDVFEPRLLEFARVDGDPGLGSRAPAAIDSLVDREARLAALIGSPVSGKLAAARRFTARAGRRLVVVDVPGLLRSRLRAASAVRLIFREAFLSASVVYWAAAERLWDEDERSADALAAVKSELEFWPIVCLLGGEAQWEPPPVLGGHAVARVPMPALSTQDRTDCWREQLLAAGAPEELGAELETLSASFRLSAEQIHDAVTVARSLAEVEGDAMHLTQLYAGARAVSGRRLAALGQEIAPKARWADLILPDDALCQLRELCSTVRHRARVLEEWGFAERLTRGTGVTALFTGLSGTGKTMAAEIVAGELGLALFRIDLSGIVSKWIGETEKNLDRVFQAASDSNAILFFDEADALFGKRSEVKDSHDRYANLEISYLLQKMEGYEGVAILATNMRQQLDDAFLRRLTFMVAFAVPEAPDRERIWLAIWPANLPRADDVDFNRLSRIKLAGGNIKNTVLAAAHMAAAEDRPVAMHDLVHAIRREYQKMGKTTPHEEILAALG